MEQINNQEEIKHKGVGGWLLFLCLSLVIFSPLLMIRDLYSAKGMNPFLFLINVALLIFSVYAGIGLWKIRKGAVKIALIYLNVLVLLAFFSLIYSMVKGTYVYYSGMLSPFVYSIIWTSYLIKSKRVKATYGKI